MAKSVAIVGAGVSGLTCGVFFAERGVAVKIFAEKIGTQTTSGAAGALWFPYDAEPTDKVIPWALATYEVLVDLVRHRTDSPWRTNDARTGVSMIELRQYCRTGKIQIPDWASPFVMSNARHDEAERRREAETSLTVSDSVFSDGFALRVPLMDTTIYLDSL